MLIHKNVLRLGKFPSHLAPNKLLLQITAKTATEISTAIKLSTIQFCHLSKNNNINSYFGFCTLLFLICVARLFDCLYIRIHSFTTNINTRTQTIL